MTRSLRAMAASTIAIGVVVSSSGHPIAQSDPPEWITAAELRSRIQSPSSLVSQSDRTTLTKLFLDLQVALTQLKAAEQALVVRLNGHAAALKSHAPINTQYQADRAAWRARLATYTVDCDRTFTNPADVERCDGRSRILKDEERALDLRANELDARTSAFGAAQKDLQLEAARLAGERRAWISRVDMEFNLPARAALAGAKASTLRLTVKSFIKTIDLSSLSAAARPRAGQVFSWITNQNFSENPATPSPDTRDYRLWTQVTVIASCRADTIVEWKSSLLAHRGGTELKILDAETTVLEPLAMSPAAQGAGPVKTLSLSYAIKGLPNELALSSFNVVQPRSCASIWHRVRATVTCHDGRAEMTPQISGSRFPSHRAWVNDGSKPTVEQGPFANLWECDPSNPVLVR